MIEYYTIRGVIKEICPVERYGTVFRNLVVGDKYIHMAKKAIWSRDDIQVGDEVVVSCFNENISDNEEGGVYIVGISVAWLGGKRTENTPETEATNYDYIHESDVNRLAYLMCDMMDCRKCPVDHGDDCTEELKKWLKMPLGNIKNTKVCPVCGKRITRFCDLSSYPGRYQVLCGCTTTGYKDKPEEAYEEWERKVKARQNTLEAENT